MAFWSAGRPRALPAGATPAWASCLASLRAPPFLRVARVWAAADAEIGPSCLAARRGGGRVAGRVGRGEWGVATLPCRVPVAEPLRQMQGNQAGGRLLAHADP